MDPPSGTPTLTHVDINVDDPDDSHKTLQLGMDESYTLDVPTTGTATIRAPTVWGALRALETLDLSVNELTGQSKDITQIVSSTTSHTISQKHRCLAARAYPDEGAGLQCVAQQEHRLHVAG